jgi:hypothetical protein
MMDQEVLTLNQVLSTETELSEKKMKDTESCDSIAKLEKFLTKEVKILWPIACNFILKKLMEVLNVKVPDVLVTAWSKYKDIAQYTNKKRYPPSETYMVPLATHTVESIYEPSIEVLFNNQLIGEIKFEITVFLVVEGIILEIKGGKIMKLHTGSFYGGGSIKCEGKLIFEKQTNPFTLPGVIDLGEGISIPKLPVQN